MKKFKLVLLLILLSTIVSFAQQRQDVVYLKNGDIYKGQIIKDVPGEYLQLEMKDGSIKRLNYSEIEKREVSNISTENNEDESTLQFWDYVHKGFDFNLIVFDFDYSEHVVLPCKSTENGIIKGFNIGFSSNKSYPFWITSLIGYSWAEEDYDGSTQPPLCEPLQMKTKSSFFRFCNKLGYKFNLTDEIELSPFVGYDIRSWDRDIQGEGGIQEIYTWQNIPVGFKFNCLLNDEINIGIQSQVNLMVNGNIKMMFSKLDSRNPDIILNLGNVIGFEVNAYINYKINESITLNFIPFFEKYAFDQSNSYIQYQNGQKVLEIYEPSSTTYIFGANAGISINF